MAYREKEPHAFTKIQKAIKDNKVPQLVFLHGVEQYLVNWAIGRLVDSYTNEATRTLDMNEFETSETGLDEVIQSCETLPMMSERKVIVLKDFTPMWGKRPQNIGEDELKSFEEYLKNLPAHLLLIATTDDSGENQPPSKRKHGESYKITKEVGSIYNFEPLDERNLRKFIIKRFQETGKNIESREVSSIISDSGYYNKDIDYTLYNLEGDIKKIAFHAKGDSIKDEDVSACLSDTLEKGVFKLIDAISNNRKNEGFALLHELILSGEQDIKILSIIVGQLEIMLEGVEMRDEGLGMDSIKKELGVHEYRLKKAMQAANAYDSGKLRRMLYNALQVEDDFKSGRMPSELALEMFVASI